MAIFRLTPINPADSHWSDCNWRKPVQVRAPNERRARLVAARDLAEAEARCGRNLDDNPWVEPELVHCEEVPESPFPSIGEISVLTPKFARH